MPDDLVARFLPQFLSLARARVASMIARVAGGNHAEIQKIMRELHTLVGEAGLLGLGDIVSVVRDCEKKAKELHVSRTEQNTEALVAALRQLERVVEGSATTNSPTAGGT
jgi:HPt (histidine-containing phosphotransfer) domain-containing protein